MIRYSVRQKYCLLEAFTKSSITSTNADSDVLQEYPRNHLATHQKTPSQPHSNMLKHALLPKLPIQSAAPVTRLINLDVVVIYCLFLFILEDVSSLISDLSLSPPTIHLFYPLFPVLIPLSMSGDRQGRHLGPDRDR